MRTIMVLLVAVAAGSVLTFSAASAARKPVTKTFHVALTGEAESPAGDPVATGTATIRLRTDGRVCYQLAAKNLPRGSLPRTSTRARRASRATSSSR